jgi:CarboxypepD_reg-like domain
LRKRLHISICWLLICTIFFVQNANAQNITIKGRVFDISARRPLEAVAVISTSGKGTTTDSLGRYEIRVSVKDSIWFSMIGKSTMKYPVDTISNNENFDVMIHVRSFDLPEVKVRNSYYKLDSVQNRKDYAKIFDFKKPGLRLSENPGYNPGGLTVGFDLDEIINMFRFKRNKSLASLQQRLLQQEEDKYIDHRFSMAFVRKVTKLTSPELEEFMKEYRPDYEMVQRMNELELGYFIEKNYEEYRTNKYNKGAPRKY